MTTELSGDKYVTISKRIPMINCITKKNQSIYLELETVKILKLELKKELVRSFGKVEITPNPPFKRIHFQQHNEATETIKSIRQMIKSEVDKLRTSSASAEAGTTTGTCLEFIESFYKSII